MLIEVKEQKAGPFFGLMADEVTDVSNWEQLGVIIRYIRDDVPEERLMEFIKYEKIKGDDIADHILSSVTRLGLDPTKC